MNPEKDPPTHTLWSQQRDKGKFREWYRRGHLWLDKTPDGQTIGCFFEGVPDPRGSDGFTYFFPNGMQPPEPQTPPPKAQRPGAQPFAADEEDL